MDKQETTTTNNKTLRLTITIDIDRDTVPSFGTVRRDGQIGAWNIAENLEEMGMTVKSIDVNARSVIETETED
mgnify:CR=1 FL=1